MSFYIFLLLLQLFRCVPHFLQVRYLHFHKTIYQSNAYEFIFLYANERLIARGEYESLDAATLRLAINEIYALHIHERESLLD